MYPPYPIELPKPRPTPSRPGRLAIVAACVTLAVTGVAQAQPNWQVIASNLDNPRGLDFAPNGALYIAEAGRGGNGPEVPGPEGKAYFGRSGAITRVFKGVQERIVTGLPSVANAQGFSAAGPADISFGQQGHAALTIGLGLNPAVRDSVLGSAGAGMGVLYQLNQNGQLKAIVDLAAFEGGNDPDGNGPDSNPFGAISDKAGAVYVADSGANALLKVAANGTPSVVAVFGNRLVPTPPFLPPGQMPMQSVPTSVVRGPDGALYVSELTGFPFVPGSARIHRVVPGQAPTVFATGFTNVIDLEFDSQGNLYVLEVDQNGLLAPSPTGRLARVNAADGSVTTIASNGLVMPGGIAIGPDGAVYVTNYSHAPGLGEVVRIVP